VTEAEILASLRAYGAALAADNAASKMDYHIACQPCESPIERIMLAALMAASEERHSEAFLEVFEGDPEACEKFLDDVIYSEHFHVALQFPIGNYRADLCLGCYDGIKIAIECDGHDWHERTHEQAQRDRSRDRAIQCAGFIVLRFTGREIWRAPLGCAKQVFDAFDKEWQRRHARAQDRDTP
jgi:very-short-patch-repair endonuclease